MVAVLQPAPVEEMGAVLVREDAVVAVAMAVVVAVEGVAVEEVS